ncbi:outer membrane protein, family, partial [human gut metagenome]
PVISGHFAIMRISLAASSRLDEFYKQIAVAYGLGLRLNFDYFILRLDMGMKAINPAYGTKEEHWAIIHPKLDRDFAFHFAVGLPF